MFINFQNKKEFVDFFKNEKNSNPFVKVWKCGSIFDKSTTKKMVRMILDSPLRGSEVLTYIEKEKMNDCDIAGCYEVK